MTHAVLNQERDDDLLTRGHARRDLARIATFAGVGLATTTYARPAPASGGVPDPAPTAKHRIGANECGTGPLAPGHLAAAKIIGNGSRYSPRDERGDFHQCGNAGRGRTL